MKIKTPPIDRHPGDKDPLIVVTGCGRSGTQYIAKVLKALGKHIGHERWYSQGIVSWYIVRGGYLDYFKQQTKDRKIIVLHQTRFPLHVISSFITRDGVRWLRQVLPDVKDSDTNLQICIKYWYYWNIWISQTFDIAFRYNVEDITNDKTLYKFCNTIGVTLTSRRISKIKNISKDIHTGHKGDGRRMRTRARKQYDKRYSWKELDEADKELTLSVKELAESYNYDLGV